MESITTQQLAVVLFALTSAIVNPDAGEAEGAGVEVAVGVGVVGAVVPVEVPGVFGFAELLVGDGLSGSPADVPDAPSSPGVAVLS